MTMSSPRAAHSMFVRHENKSKHSAKNNNRIVKELNRKESKGVILTFYEVKEKLVK